MKITNYFKPKSLVYTGSIDEQTVVNRYVYDKDQIEIYDDIKLHDKQYIKVVGLNDIETLEKVKQTFNIDDFIMEDILNVKQRNKIEQVDQYIFACFSLMYKEKDEVKKAYMSLVFNEHVLISFHETEPVFLSPLMDLLNHYQELKENGIDFLFYQILDLITDDHLDLYDSFELQISEFEDEMLETKQIDQDAFYRLRKRILQLKNITSPLYDHLVNTLKSDETYIKHKTKAYFNDLIDHMKRLDHRINQLRDLMRTLLDLDMNNQSTRMNKIMSTLTLFSAIFIPLSFLTGFFGMNFIHFNILSYEHAVLIFSILCLTIVGIMIYIFKTHKWF